MSWSFRSSYRSIEIVTGPALWPTVGLLALALFVQTVAAPELAVRGTVPSFTTIVVVLYALRLGARRGAFLGVVAGAATDGLAGTGGGWTIAFTVVAIAVGGIARGFFADGVVWPATVVGLAVLLRDALFWIVQAAEGYPGGFATRHLHSALIQSALTAAAALAYLTYRARFVDDATRIERYP